MQSLYYSDPELPSLLVHVLGSCQLCFETLFLLLLSHPQLLTVDWSLVLVVVR
jgi:hypothetical protein